MIVFFIISLVLTPPSDLVAQPTDTLLTVNEQVTQQCRDAWVSHDKFLHFSVGAAISGFTYYYMTTENVGSHDHTSLYALSVTACAGFTKELYDYNRTGETSYIIDENNKDLFPATHSFRVPNEPWDPGTDVFPMPIIYYGIILIISIIVATLFFIWVRKSKKSKPQNIH